MRIFSLLCLSGFLAISASMPCVFAADAALGIAAVVNDEVITSADVENRLRFVFATTGISDSQESRERIIPQIVRQLADETLQMQEAKRDNITISDAEVSKAIGEIEQQRNIPPGGLLAHLRQLGVPEDTFKRQVRAQLAWGQIAGKKLRPMVHVSEEEIERAQLHMPEDRTPTPKGMTADEVKISVLALPVEKPAQEPQVHALADKLVAEIKRGAAFEGVAREMGGGSGATKPFWIAPSQLDPNVAKALQPLANGQVSAPVRTPEGYSIVQLIDRRGGRSLAPEKDSEVLLKDVLLQLKNDAAPKEVNIMLQIGRDVSKHPGTCTDNGIAGVENVQDYDIQVNFRRMRTSDMTDAVRDLLKGLNVGDVSQPFATPEGIRFFMLCERVEAAPKMSSREETYSRLMQQKMQLEGQKFMRNLRRDATVDVRL